MRNAEPGVWKVRLIGAPAAHASEFRFPRFATRI
jgi:hypothetical protein